MTTENQAPEGGPALSSGELLDLCHKHAPDCPTVQAIALARAVLAAQPREGGPDLRAAAQKAFDLLTDSRWGTVPYMDSQVYEDAANAIRALRAALAAQPAAPTTPEGEPLGAHLLRLARKHDLSADFLAAIRQAAELLAAQPQAAPVAQWQPIETAPKDGRKLILFYLNRNGKARTVMARWVTDEEAAETDADGVGLEGGWYERIDNWDEYSQVAIHEGEPSHWMPLPAAPQTKEPTNDR